MIDQKSLLPSPHQTPQIPNIIHDQRHERILTMLKHSVLSKLASTTNSPVSVFGPTTIQLIMQQVFPQSFHTPTHPTYASMILRAIDELKEEQGSSEVAISEFIKREYNDLPWGHDSFLSHHLRKLCRNGDIKCTRDGRYMLQHMFEGENEEEWQQSEVCNTLFEDRWKLKQSPHGESKSDTSMIEGQLCQKREDSADEKQRHQEQRIGVTSKTMDSCYDNVDGLKVPLLAMGTTEEKLQRLKWHNDAIRKERLQIDVKPQIFPSFQDGDEKDFSLNIPQKALALSSQPQQENLEQSQPRQPPCVDDGSVVPTLNQLQQMRNCQSNESKLCQTDLSAFSELLVDSISKILPKQGTELKSSAIASCSSNAKQHLKQQPPKCERGRAHKLISDVETTSVVSSQSCYYNFENNEESQLPQCQGQGRPSNVICDAEETPSEKAAMVSSESYHFKFYNHEEIQLAECEGQGRPRKLISDVGEETVVPSESYHYKFYNLEETKLAQPQGRGRPLKIICNKGKITVVSSQSYHYKFYKLEETKLAEDGGVGKIRTAPEIRKPLQYITDECVEANKLERMT